ncbi:MAG: 50S ribosomal protein L29 [Candidatus Gracilibacteria bacterium]|jgi:ribosomal protein L29
MKTIELEQLKKMELAKLNAELLDARKELFETRFEVSNGQSKSAHLIGINKKYIAQIKTVIKQNEKQETHNNSKN